MTKCIVCGNSEGKEIVYRILPVKGYKEIEHVENKKNSQEGTQVTRKVIEKGVLLEAPGEELKGSVCKSCIRKSRKSSYVGLLISGIALLGLLGLFIFPLEFSGLFIRIGVFLTLILMVIFALPLFRKEEIEVADQFFLKARADKDEPVISVQDLGYYYGRKIPHWLMMRESHWEELEEEDQDQIRILYFS